MWYLKNVSSWVKDVGKADTFSSTEWSVHSFMDEEMDRKKGRIWVISLDENVIYHQKFAPSSASFFLSFDGFLPKCLHQNSHQTIYQHAICKQSE